MAISKKCECGGKAFYIDTAKEFVTLSNISKPALVEIETKISGYMLEQKQKYVTVKPEVTQNKDI